MTNKSASRTPSPGPDRGLSGLEEAARAARGGRGAAPVESWSPPDRGDLDIRIAADGRWYYLGSPIQRLPLVRLFSSILRRDGDRYVLVTPAEKVGIIVEDAPFVAVEVEVTGRGSRQQRLVFRTNVDDTTVAGPDHPLRVEIDPETAEPRPYVHVRGGLEALIARPVFYELVDLAESRSTPNGEVLGLWSEGCFFEIGPLPADEG